MSADIQNIRQPLLTSIKHSLLYLTLIPFIAMILVTWVSYHRVNDFKSNQIAIAASVVNAVAQETGRIVIKQRKLFDIFVKNERYYIKKLATDPDNEIFEEILAKKLRYYFPNYFAFNVVDTEGNLIAEDYDGYIGRVCVRDIMAYAKTGEQSLQVHPNPFVYHTDVITKIDRDKKGGYFFASFATDAFSRVLELSSPNDQSLMLINTQGAELIEIVEQGARNILDRSSFSLTSSEKQRILFSTMVDGTHWRLVSLRDQNLFSDYKQEVITIAVIIILIFILTSGFMIVTLCRAEKQRITLERSKEEMFSLFSHELRSPLTSIYGTIQLLDYNAQLHGFDDGTKKMIADAVSNSEHMIMLINDLLDMQKLESGKMTFKFERIELNSFIKDAMGLNAQFAEMHHVELNFTPIDNLHVEMDRQRFYQVMTNLLSNAIKYSPENASVTITLAVESRSVVIRVADNGPGISADVKDNLFDKFVQSTSHLTKRVGGTGLGLSIVKSIVDEHGGVVSYTSTRGQGTEFSVKIPIKQSF